MKSNLALVTAFAAPASGRVAVASDREVYQRAVTQGDLGGRVCPSTGETGVQAIAWLGGDLSTRHGFLPSGSAILARHRAPIGASSAPNSVMSNVTTSKPGTGYCAMSGSG